jgi:hypothetical protein
VLTKEDKEKIIQMKREGYSYDKIHNELGFAPDTIRKVWKEEELRIIKEGEEKRSDNKKVKEGQILGGIISFDSPIDEIKELAVNLDNLVKKGKLKIEDQKIWEKRIEDLRELIRMEVDNCIALERADAVKIRDDRWRETLDQHYVKKNVAADLDNTIKARDAIIAGLRNEIVDKDGVLCYYQNEVFRLKAAYQCEIDDLENQLRDRSLEIYDLMERNRNLIDYIDNHPVNDVRRGQEKLKHDREVLNVEKKDNEQFVEKQQSNLDALFLDVDEKLKDIDRREKRLVENEEKLKKREEDFDKKVKQIFDTLKERIKAVEKREVIVSELEKGNFFPLKKEVKEDI